MRLATISDVGRIEEICNDPRIRMWTAFDGAPPCSALKYVTAPSFTIIGDEGCMLCPHLAGETFGIHVNLLPHCRGARAIEAGVRALTMAFDQPGVQELLATVPHCVPQSVWMARHMGFRYVYDMPPVWPVGDQLYTLGVFRLTKEAWKNEVESRRKELCHG